MRDLVYVCVRRCMCVRVRVCACKKTYTRIAKSMLRAANFSNSKKKLNVCRAKQVKRQQQQHQPMENITTL